MNSRCLLNSNSIVQSSSSYAEREDRDGSSRNRPQLVSSPPTFSVRMAMRISRSRWFTLLRRVFHYQNGSRSNLGSNPFNSSTWLMLEFIVLIVQIIISTFTLAISMREKPVWPMRVWISGYDIGCVLNLLMVYGRYRQIYLIQGDALSLSDMEQQRNNEETRMPHLMNKCRTSLEFFFAICTLLGYNMNMASSNKGATDEQISQLPSWIHKEPHTKLEPADDSESIENFINEDPECCICLAKYKDKEELRQLPCSHVFHLKCVDQWLKIISCCPLCKQGLERLCCGW
ncbi:RING/U-box superfamily protein [Trifolium repens]|nr:RING/U-box superfamily protein [Trifolium repens]